jgi:hypothetical protein
MRLAKGPEAVKVLLEAAAAVIDMQRMSKVARYGVNSVLGMFMSSSVHSASSSAFGLLCAYLNQPPNRTGI